jgi:hypothetical protein
VRFKTSSFVVPLLAVAGCLVAQDLGRLFQSEPEAIVARADAPRVKAQHPVVKHPSLANPEGE